MELVCGLNSIMAQTPPLFNENQQLDESEIVDFLANKAPRTHKAVMISKGFNPKTGDLATFVEHCKRDETTNNIAMANFPHSDKDSDTMKTNTVPVRLKSMKKVVRNVARTPPFIVASMEKTQFTPQGSENPSIKGLHKRTIQIMSRNTTRRSSRN